MDNQTKEILIKIQEEIKAIRPTKYDVVVFQWDIIKMIDRYIKDN